MSVDADPTSITSLLDALASNARDVHYEGLVVPSNIVREYTNELLALVVECIRDAEKIRDGVSLPVILTLRHQDFDQESWEEALDDALRLHNPWALRKTMPNTDQWIVDVLDIGRACDSCAYAFEVELLGQPVTADALLVKLGNPDKASET